MATPLLDNVQITELPEDNSAEMNITNSRGLIVHVIYNQGDESHLHMQVSFSTIRDDNGSEIWSDWSDINQVSGPDKHLIENNPFKIADTGNYRFPLIPVSPREDKVRFRVYAGSAVTVGGTVTLFVVNDKHLSQDQVINE